MFKRLEKFIEDKYAEEYLSSHVTVTLKPIPYSQVFIDSYEHHWQLLFAGVINGNFSLPKSQF